MDKEQFINDEIEYLEKDIACQLEIIRIRNKHFPPCSDCPKTRLFYAQTAEIRKGIEIGLVIAYDIASRENPLLAIEDYLQHIAFINDESSKEFS